MPVRGMRTGRVGRSIPRPSPSGRRPEEVLTDCTRTTTVLVAVLVEVGATRHGRQHRHLVVVTHRVGALRRLSVAPHLRPFEHCGEVLSVAIRGRIEHRADGGSRRARPVPSPLRLVRRRRAGGRPWQTASLEARRSRTGNPHRPPMGGASGAASYHRWMARILLVRHGESEWNALGRWQGQADSPLSDLGRQQAKAASRSAGLGRCGRQLGPPAGPGDRRDPRPPSWASARSSSMPDLRERDAGEWSGLTRARDPRAVPRAGCPTTRRSATARTSHELTAAARVGERRGPAAPGPRRPRLASPRSSETARRSRSPTAVSCTRSKATSAAGGPASPTSGDGGWRSPTTVSTLGERVILVDPHDVAVTTPDQI